MSATRGDRVCRTCGKPHDLRPREHGFGTWADPDDGHAYHPIAWPELAIALAEEHGIDLRTYVPPKARS